MASDLKTKEAEMEQVDSGLKFGDGLGIDVTHTTLASPALGSSGIRDSSLACRNCLAWEVGGDESNR